MSKKRILNSKIRQSQSFMKLTYRQRDLWQGLIAVADDQGRMPGTGAHIRSLIWPVDDITLQEVEKDLNRLIELEMIYRYKVADDVYIQLINWWKYQSWQWVGLSDYPAPPGWMDRARYHGPSKAIITVNWDHPGGFSDLPAPPDNPNEHLSPDLSGDLSGDKSGEVAADLSALILTPPPPPPLTLTLTPTLTPSLPDPPPKDDLITDFSITQLVAQSTGMVCIPPSESERVEQIHSLVEAYGGERVVEAFTQAYTKWTSTRRSDGSRPYRRTNFAWVDWAQEILSGGAIEDRPMTAEEKFLAATRELEARLDNPS